MPEISRKSPSRSIRQISPPDVAREAVPQSRNARRRMVEEPQHVDAGLVITLVLMLCFGLVMLFSASMSESISNVGGGTSYLFRQLLANVLGVVAIFFVTKFNIKIFDRPQLAVFFYVLSLMLLVMTWFSTPINGARRWLSVPLFGSFQPSELFKVVVVYTLACYESWLNKERAMGRFKRTRGFRGAMRGAWLDIMLPVIILGLPILVVFFQPHVSGVIILSAVAIVCLLSAGLPLRSWIVSSIIGLLVLGILIGAFIAFRPMLPEKIVSRFDHVVTRMEIFTDAEEATDDEYYQSRQALIAIGSGGLLGVGLGQGKQKNNYLPEGHNDYIFSNLVEELGMIGGIAVILLFLIFFILGLRVAFKASSVYAQIVAGGISSLITIQALLNIGVNVGAIPPTGISLPFFSYGGTSNMFFLIGVGLLLNVSKYGLRKPDTAAIAEAR